MKEKKKKRRCCAEKNKKSEQRYGVEREREGEKTFLSPLFFDSIMAFSFDRMGFSCTEPLLHMRVIFFLFFSQKNNGPTPRPLPGYIHKSECGGG